MYYECLGLGDPLAHKSPHAQRFLSHLRHPVCLELGVVLWLLPALSLDRLLLAGTLSTYLALAHSLDKQDLAYLCVQLKSKMYLFAEPHRGSTSAVTEQDDSNHKEKWGQATLFWSCLDIYQKYCFTADFSCGCDPLWAWYVMFLCLWMWFLKRRPSSFKNFWKNKPSLEMKTRQCFQDVTLSKVNCVICFKFWSIQEEIFVQMDFTQRIFTKENYCAELFLFIPLVCLYKLLHSTCQLHLHCISLKAHFIFDCPWRTLPHWDFTAGKSCLSLLDGKISKSCDISDTMNVFPQFFSRHVGVGSTSD